jgi:tRNA-specific 2-thiouridylase
MRLGFDAVATGHHARVDHGGSRPRLLRGADAHKDQSYVLACLTERELRPLLLPIGALTKPEVRLVAAGFGLPTAAKPDSQEVCFVLGGGGVSARSRFLSERLPLHPGEVIDIITGELVGTVPAVELVTVGQRRGLGVAGGEQRFAVRVDVEQRRIEVGSNEDLLEGGVSLAQRTWVHEAVPTGTPVLAQASAHGLAFKAFVNEDGLAFEAPRRRVAPGQTVAMYLGDEVVGSGIATGAAA